ncbi:MAG: hypothetical protein E7Z96_02895 [Actinomycetaceae bacterium]|jgi:hypothetical protein|nr:hypothetical protein [Actinomycetaceae bacterium]
MTGSPSRRVNLRGVVSAISYPGSETPPTLEVMLQVGDNSLLLAFLGRTDLHCVDIGSRLHVKGTLTSHNGVPTVFNPWFTVLPTHVDALR